MKLNKRAVVLLVSLVAILTIAVGATLAIVFTGTGTLQNIFAPAKVTCDVQNGTNGATVKNTGDTAAYIRVAVVANWVADGKIYIQQPSITIAPDNGWVLHEGYYYYTQPVAVGGQTPVLKITEPASTTLTVDGVTYSLKIQVLASAVQATPANVVTSAWGVDPSTLAN